MDRQQLIAAWETMVVEGKDKPVESPTVERLPAGYDPEVEREKLRWEQQKFAQKMEMEKERMVFEKTKMDELLKRKEDKIQIERASLKMQQQKEANEATRLKKYSDALRGQSPDRQMTL